MKRRGVHAFRHDVYREHGNSGEWMVDIHLMLDMGTIKIINFAFKDKTLAERAGRELEHDFERSREKYLKYKVNRW